MRIDIGRFLKALTALAVVVFLVFIVYEIFFNKTEPKDNNNDLNWNSSYQPYGTPTPETAPQASDTPGSSTQQPGTTDYVAPPGTTRTPIPTYTPAPTPTATERPTNAPTRKPTATPTSSALRNGSEGAKVKAVQQRLKQLGYLTGSADGVFGDGTEAAVKAFQKANGLTADGVVGTGTLNKLNSSSAKAKSTESQAKATARPTPRSYTPSEPENYRYLQLGSTGSDVKKLQNRLIELGYLSGSASGSFDQATHDAVLAFQQRNGQWVDGVAGEDTQSALFGKDALPARR